MRPKKTNIAAINGKITKIDEKECTTFVCGHAMNK